MVAGFSKIAAASPKWRRYKPPSRMMWLGEFAYYDVISVFLFSQSEPLPRKIPRIVKEMECAMSSVDKFSTWLIALILLVILIFFYPGPW
jgi:hypothetical protein